jgi:alkylation response protein AidB-like acyl-CoA dehydrogenase
MQIPAQYRMAESLETYLGNPADSNSPFSFASALELDEREEYPSKFHDVLDSWDLGEIYIPAELGGRLQSFEEMLAALRTLSRRDLTVAISHVLTYTAAVPLWIGGSDQQKRALADLIRGRHKVALALTEREHGSDLLANEFEAREQDGRYLLFGEKWLIGNATRATAIALFARIKPEGGPRGFSLFLIDKRFLDSARFQHLPKVPTVGLRGADLSGVCFDRCELRSDARIGPAGAGLELTLKGLQVTRTLCAGLSLGAADTALRLALDFAISRRLYGETVFSIPHANSILCNAFTDLMICDCVAISAARALQVCPGQASVWSAVAKYFVPATVESVLRQLSIVLGARFFLRAGHQWNMFQKMVRDSSIVSVFEGSSVVQLHALALQLQQLTGERRICSQELTGRLERVFSLTEPLPAFEATHLDLFSRDGDDAVSGIGLVCDQLRSAGVGETALNCASIVSRQYAQLTAEIRQAQKEQARSFQLLELARRFTHIHAAACCVSFWLYNRGTLGEFFCREEWLSGCINRLCSEDKTMIDTGIERELVQRYKGRQLFSAVPFEIA